MKSVLFQRSLLAVAISGAATLPVNAWSDSLLDGASEVLTLRSAATGYSVSGFDTVVLPGGSLVVVWTEHNGAANDKLLLQLFTRSGESIGSVRTLAQAEDATTAFEYPTVGADQFGNLAVAWTVGANVISSVCDSDSTGIRALTVSPPYNSTSQLPLYANMGTVPCGPEIAMDNDGDFVLVWADRNGFQNFDISIQTYLAGGVPNRGHKDFLTGLDAPATVALQDNQRMLLGWEKNNQAVGRYHDLQLNQLSSSFDLSNDNIADFSVTISSVSVSNDFEGGFVAFWNNENTNEFFAQRWSKDGSAGDGVELFAYSSGSNNIGIPSLAADSEGHLFSSTDEDFSSGVIVASAVDKNGQNVADNINYEIKSLSGALVQHSKVAMNNDTIVVAWVPSGGTTLEARLFEPLASTPTPGSRSFLDTIGAGHPWLMVLLAGLLAVWRRLIKR